jgi:hypothetical protein
MTNDSIHALGPLFGPDFVLIEVIDETKTTYALEIFPDANNPALRRCNKTHGRKRRQISAHASCRRPEWMSARRS